MNEAWIVERYVKCNTGELGKRIDCIPLERSNSNSKKENEVKLTKEIGAEPCRFISSAPLVPFLIRRKMIITISIMTAVAVRKKWKSIKTMTMKSLLTTVE